MKMLNTVNVIEKRDETTISLRAFPETEEGNKAAEKIFAEILDENETTVENIDSYVEDGYWESGTYQLFLVHSS
jgi:hypothetical protein